MQIKLLNDILSNVVGRQASDIVNLLAGKKNVNEFILAKKLKLTINQVRNILYKLSHAGLVSFTRKKDKRKGWYTYFWTLNIGKSLELLEGNLIKELESLKNQLKNRESRRFYFCNTCKTEVNEETALLHNFTCSECGEVYELQTDKKILNDLMLKIKKLEAAVMIIEEELSKVRVKETKKQVNLDKKEMADKKKSRAKKRNDRRREKKKEKRREEKSKKKSKKKSKPKKSKKKIKRKNKKLRKKKRV